MDVDFGYSQIGQSDNAESDNKSTIENSTTNITTGTIEHDANGEPVSEIENSSNKPDDSSSTQSELNATAVNQTNNRLEAGTVIEVDNESYTVDDKGNVLDANGNVFKEASEVQNWIDGFDKVTDNNNDVTIDAIQDAIGLDILDENDQPIKFDNTVEGISSYIYEVVASAKEESETAAINTLFERYPILGDVLNYYIANGNSLQGYGMVPDRSGITIDEHNEAQQEAIIRESWKEQNRKGDIDSYINYLKSSGALLHAAQTELEALQENDANYRKNVAEEANAREKQRVEKENEKWENIKTTIDNRTLAGYRIPESIIIDRDGKKLSVTPEDFYNYLYLIDENGNSAYDIDYQNKSYEERLEDNLLRAYLTFVGGNYSNLVDMAINNEKVNKLKLKAKERNNSTIKINKPKTNKETNIDFGYN